MARLLSQAHLKNSLALKKPLFGRLNTEYFRNLMFGIEDGFVSTAGVMFGIATATSDRRYILIAGIITVIVEATSMGIGAYLSEKSSKELDGRHHHQMKSIIDGIVMFFAYGIAGSLCVAPYALWTPSLAKLVSVIITLIGLFLLGFLPTKSYKRGIEVSALAGVAMFIGYLAGNLLQRL